MVPKTLTKEQFPLSLGPHRGQGGCERVSLESHSPSSLASEQLWAVREGDQSHFSRTLCQNAGKCDTHADPASDRQGDTRARSLRSPSLPHRRYIGGFFNVTSTVPGSLASAFQPVLLAPPYHQTRLCDSVRPALGYVIQTILNYLDDWLILAQSQDQLCEHRDLVLSHLSRLGIRVN